MDDWTRRQAEAGESRVLAMESEGRAARAVVTRRPYPAPVEDVWDAIVTPERLERWFLPVSGELREGGRYQLEGNAGGVINRCEAPTLLAVTWEMQDGIGWVNVKLDARDESGCVMTLEHITHEGPGFLTFWEQFGPGALGVGWDIGLRGLADHLRGEGDPLIGDEAVWVASDDGQGFLRIACDGWVTAEVEFGTDAAQAQQAGARTFAFYTGADEGGAG